jgi:ABC-type sugar transport system ATPase subunit
MSWLSVNEVTKTFPGGTVALDRITLSVSRGEFFTIVGPTNAGKSTLLKTIAGLRRPDHGRITLNGRDITLLEPRERKLSLLFQNIALFPTLTGFDNIAFPLRAARMEASEVTRRVHALASMLRIEHVLDRLPRTFSGGEQQRVAIGRALAAPCDVLLLDEPLTNLDARLRIELRIELKALHRNTGQTILYVTHDQTEAFSLSDRIAVLDQGEVQQLATPDEIFERPANRFVATFMGMPPMNILASHPAETAGHPIGIRPESVRVARTAGPTTPFAAEVRWIERLGAKNILDLEANGQTIKAVVRPDHQVSAEGPAFFGFDPGSIHRLDPVTHRFVR